MGFTRKPFGASDIRFIQNYRLLMSTHDIAVQLSRQESQVQRYMKENGWTAPREVWKKFRTDKLKKHTSSNAVVDHKLKRKYLSTNVSQLSRFVGRSETFIRTRMRQLGLVQPRELVEKFIQEARFQKGCVPVNKGKKQIEFMSRAGIERTLATRFKKGMVHAQQKPVDVITIRYHKLKDGGVRGYQWIKIKKHKWAMLHVHNWQKKNGRVPKGHIIVFKNGDTMNCDISNLECITLAQNCIRNSIHRYPAEIQLSMKALGRLKKKIIRHENKIDRP